MGPRAVLFPLEHRQICVPSRESNHHCSIIEPLDSTVKTRDELSKRHDSDNVMACWLRFYCTRRQTQAMGDARASQRGYTEWSLSSLRQSTVYDKVPRLLPFVLLATAACR